MGRLLDLRMFVRMWRRRLWRRLRQQRWWLRRRRLWWRLWGLRWLRQLRPLTGTQVTFSGAGSSDDTTAAEDLTRLIIEFCARL